MRLGNQTAIRPDGEDFIQPAAQDDREIPETTFKLLFCGLEKGFFELFDFGSKVHVPVTCA